MPKSLLTYCLEEITDSASMDGLQKYLFDFCDVYSVNHAVLHVTNIPAISEENSLLVLTYPEQWIETYIRKNYFTIDPVVNAGRSGFLPFDWSSLDLKSPSTAAFFREAESFEIGRHGLTITVRGPRGERSLFTITSNLTSGKWAALRDRRMGDFQVIAAYLHEQAMILSGVRGGGGVPRLSRRETQCLQLLARGLLPKQMAAHLEISESAVRLYLSSGRRKLHVATTNQAIAKAISLELING